VERSSAIRYTYQDLLSLPEGHTRYEILDGQLFVTPTPRLDHQRVAHNLVLLMQPLARTHELGEVVGPMTVRIHDEMVFEPDLIFIRSDRMEIADPDGHVHGAPDLVIEILSPSARSYDRNLKRKKYLESGIPELWLVDVDAKGVEVWRAGATEAERPEGFVTWRVGDEAFELPFGEVFRGA
jgi:Uma2 family endonuclease